MCYNLLMNEFHNLRQEREPKHFNLSLITATFDNDSRIRAFVHEVDSKGKVVESLGVGSGDTTALAVEAAIRRAKENGSILPGDTYEILNITHRGRLNVETGLEKLKDARVIDKAQELEAIAILRGRGGQDQ
jgi:effector-binding domain-containing protein